LDAAFEYFRSIDWSTFVLGAVLGGLSSAIALLIKLLIQVPAKQIASNYNIIKLFSRISWNKVFVGTWEVNWEVISDNFPEVNTDHTKIYCLFSNIAFETCTVLKDGTAARCVFVGKIQERTLTGRWYDPVQEGIGYYGVFQVRLSGNLKQASGQWSGWANNGKIQSDKMTMIRVD
jgi:hypothetical protein